MDTGAWGTADADTVTADQWTAAYCASPECVKILDRDGRIEFFNDDGYRLMEIDDPATVLGAYWPDLWPEEARPSLEIALGQARRSGTAHVSAPCPTAKGAPRWWDVTITTYPGGADRIIVISRDVTERTQQAEVERLVAAELSHRINNMLAVVAGLFRNSVGGCADVATLDTVFSGRLAAMAAAHRAVIRGGSDGVDLADLVAAHLGPFTGAGRLDARGAAVTVPARLAQPLALALNELATNALKYGALANATGTVDLDWRVDDTRLHIAWAESGGPPVAEPARVGLGSRLIERGIPRATVTRTFAPDGLRCTFDIALDPPGGMQEP